ncbi:phosphoadenylyl-sulfate reductase [Paenibacillus yanchengensis]|uniref:Adenosine 5'-phosphosulfate reductase n=1 Tax=Paenibacillus yanchengensis TaxID=2035833 RepID=A0ABW4YNK5_9BACL
MITYHHWDEKLIPSFPSHSATKGALEVIQWAYDSYGEQLIYSCSFGMEGIVLLDLIAKVNPSATVVFLDTNYHFSQTYDVINKVKLRYPQLNIHLQQPALTIAEQTEQYGENLYASNPNKCCELRKIKPLEQVIAPYTAWLSGLRHEQSETRKQTQYVNQDIRFEKVKICPLIYWTWQEVTDFVTIHQLDYNVLHDQGYPSIGCEPCTRAVTSADDFRSGRWDGTLKTECGLHTATSFNKNT